MSDPAQVGLALAPTLAVLLGILQNNARISDLRSYMDARLHGLETWIDARFDSVDRELGLVANVWDSKLSRLRDRVEVLDHK